MLSVSRPYLVLGGVYHPLWAAFSNNPTPRRPEAAAASAPMGLTPAVGRKPRSEGHRRSPAAALGLLYVTTRHAQKACRFDAGLFPVHSPLLRESLLVPFPPLSNMLKFSGCSRLNSGRNRCRRRRARTRHGRRSLSRSHHVAADANRCGVTAPATAGRHLTGPTRSPPGDTETPRPRREARRPLTNLWRRPARCRPRANALRLSETNATLRQTRSRD